MLNPQAGGKECLYQKIYRELSGKLTAGSRIPTESELAKQYNVSRITSKKATDLLVARGMITKITGKGTFVCMNTPLAPVAQEAARPEPGNPTRLVGVVMDTLLDSFGVQIIHGIEAACSQNGFSLVLKFILNDIERETESINELLQLGVSGIILMCAPFETYNQKILELSLQDFPVIFIDRYLPGLAIPYVGTDHEHACRSLTDAMFARGHQELALAMCDKATLMTSVTERVNGYVSSCMQHHHASGMNRLLVAGDTSMSVPDDEYAQSVDSVYDYLVVNPKITGLVALSNGIAFVLCAAARRLRERENRVVEVACFDAALRHDPYEHPVLSIDQDQFLIGRRAVECLKLKLAQGSAPKATLIPYQLTDLACAADTPGGK